LRFVVVVVRAVVHVVPSLFVTRFRLLLLLRNVVPLFVMRLPLRYVIGFVVRCSFALLRCWLLVWTLFTSLALPLDCYCWCTTLVRVPFLRSVMPFDCYVR